MARLHGYSADTPLRAIVGPGEMRANVDEALLTPATAWDAAAQEAFRTSGTLLGASDDGYSFNYSPSYEQWGFAGVPENIKGGRRITSVETSLSGSLTEIVEDNVKKFAPGSSSSAWETTEATPTRIGAKIQPTGLLLDSDYITNICVIAERQGQKIGGVFIVKNALNVEDFTLGLAGDENRSNVDVDFMGHYGEVDQDPDTGAWLAPCVMYLADAPVAA